MQFYTHHPMVDYMGGISDYKNSMDPGNYSPSTGEQLNMSIKDIGMSVPMGISAANVSGIYSKIRMGAGSIEIGFPGVFSGQRQAQTPGMYGEDQRQAIKELAKINEINLTTHSAYNIMGLMGRDQRDNFSLTNAKASELEIERAIDFAADTAGKGSVVVHTGEWERPLTDITVDDATWQKNYSYSDDGRLMFRKRVPELHDANFVLLDDRTSQKMETVQKDRKVAVPKWRKAEDDYEGIYQDNIHIIDPNDKWMENYKGQKVKIKKGDYIDYEGKKIINPYDPKYGRVPEFDEGTSRFKVEYRVWDDFIEEAKEQTEWKRQHWVEMTGKRPENDEHWYYDGVIYPDEAFLHATLETNEGHSRGWALQYAQSTATHLEAIEKLKKVKTFYEQLDENLTEDEKWKIMKQDDNIFRYTRGLVPPETKHPLKMIDELLKEHRIGLEFARQASASQQQQAEDTAETKKHIVTPLKRFKKHVARLYAEAGIRAMQRTKDPNNPIFLAIENIFPERFGGHPQELRFVIDEARKWFVKFLTKQENIDHGLMSKQNDNFEASKFGTSPFYVPGMSRQEAEKLAEKHIKATIDTGHMNMWRKFWQPKPGQSIEEADKEFRNWYVTEFEKLAKGGYIGNIHLTDNYGFQDDHIAPGQGNAPIKEILHTLKKHGYDKAITVEPGADASTDLSDFHGLMKTWRYVGAPIHGIYASGGGGGVRPQTWGDVHYSYFGQNKPPYFIFGSYSPSNDWTLWTQVPME